MRIVLGADQAVADYIARATGDPMASPFKTIGIYNKHNTLIGALALNVYTGAGIEVSGAGRAIVLRSARQALCDVVYGLLGCRRMAITVRRSNKRMRRLASELGFRFEGTARAYYGSEDGSVLSLLSAEAIALGHWVPRVGNGKTLRAA